MYFLEDVAMSSQAQAWAVGYGPGSALILRWNGSSCHARDVPTPAHGQRRLRL